MFNAVPGTEAEIGRIAKTFRERFGGRGLQVLTKSEATEEAFRTDAPRHRWIHLATRGFFSPTGVPSGLDSRTQNGQQQRAEATGSRNQIHGFDPALLSGIAFAGANRGASPADVPLSSSPKDADDGVLTALEVSELDLRNVDLTVLSAGEMGLGRVGGGEGVLGLQRAFQTAGVKTCVTSLWKVDDAAAQVLMVEFYTNLWQKKLGKLDALRQAQLRMLREYDAQQRAFASRGLDVSRDQSTGPKRGSPFYWAAFVLSGDWR